MLALFIISRKFKHYIQTFRITVLTKHPLRSIIENPKATKQILKWASKLRPYALRYEPRTTIEGQVLTDFIADFTPGATVQCEILERWVLNVDRVSNNNQKAGIGTSLQKDLLLSSLLPSVSNLQQ